MPSLCAYQFEFEFLLVHLEWLFEDFFFILRIFFHCNTFFALTKLSKTPFSQRCYFNSAAAFLHLFKIHFD